ncbi:MAG TPA: sigma-54 dependent transcriptional regulator [Vicinamibacterales bacterium]|nr:sigma-54 dependent transcriptional regulator [Vicinamibacterales bacterium]
MLAASSWVFVCDTDEGRRRQLTTTLSNDAYRVEGLPDPSALAAAAARVPRAVVVVGFAAAQIAPVLAAVHELHRLRSRVPVIFVAADGSEEVAVAALRSGVNDYFRDPVDADALQRSVLRYARPAAETATDTTLVGSSAALRQIEEYLDKVAKRNVTVLITGETGTGKELVATRIHERSARRLARFVSVNCAAIPDGLLESELFGFEMGAFTGAAAPRQGLLQIADRGTVFLDEVGDLGLTAQAKLLRAIETRQVYPLGAKKPVPLDVRLVAATNQNLEAAVDEGRFRKDLYFRLNVVRIHLPPLRERRSDIRALLDFYLRELNQDPDAHVEGFADETREALEAYDWPGNVRELKNLVDAILVAPPSRPVRLADLPESFRARLKAMPASATERRRLLDALLATNWNKSQAASILHWSRMTVYRKMAKYSVVRSA